MPSFVSGFEYDIFISYRQKDDEYDGWVTEFVSNLKRELRATFKEEVFIYFDSDPVDGLLETHRVDETLASKLKCLIFIPIVSQTYCDPKSFAWQYELLAFNSIAKKDQFGRDIKLANGNVASRILPIKIHDLDAEDKTLLENELGGVLRSIKFIYRASGINRPLKPNDERTENINHTYYRDQINKIANAVKGIITAVKNFDALISSPPLNKTLTEEIKSIVVLPFEDMSPDHQNEYFSDGLTEEIIADLSNVHDLSVISRSSAMTFKGTRKKLKEIAQEVNVRYVLEGSVRKEGNSLRITAQLIDGVTDAHLWAEKYNGTIEDVFDIQERVSRSIVEALKVKLTVTENKVISERPINNAHAYDCYLRAKSEQVKWTEEAINRARKYLQNGLDIIGPNAMLYAGMAYVYYNYANLGFQADQSWNKAEEYVSMALELDSDSPEAHMVLGLLHATLKGNQLESIRHLKRVIAARPNDLDARFWLTFEYFFVGKIEMAKELVEKMLRLDPLSANVRIMPDMVHVHEGRFELMEEPFSKAYQMEPGNPLLNLVVPFTLVYRGRRTEALKFISDHVPPGLDDFFFQIVYALKHALMKEKEIVKKILQHDKIKIWAWRDIYFSYLFAAVFALAELQADAIDWLERAVDRGFINYPFLSEYDVTLMDLRKEHRFQKLMQRVKREWENFPG